jgi:type I restriction enzyme S subunit
VSKWKEITLGEVVNIAGGGTPTRSNPDFYGGTIPWVTPKDMKSWEITGAQIALTQAGVDNSSTRVVPPNSILIVVRSGVLKHTVPIGLNRVPVAINQDMKALQCHDQIDADFLARFIKAQSHVILKWVRATTADNFPIDKLKKLPVPLPQLAEQRRIAEVLDKAEALRAKRRAALAQLDSLTQSLFLDLFGDPAFNERNWTRSPLSGVCRSADHIKCGPFGTQLSRDEFRTEGVPLWGIKNVNKLFELPTQEFLEPHTAKRLIQYSIEPGDIVMTRKGTVGNCAVYPSNLPLGIMHSDLLRLRVNPETCDPIFLTHQLHYSRDVEGQLALISGGAVMPGINVTRLKNLEVLLPPP